MNTPNEDFGVENTETATWEPKFPLPSTLIDENDGKKFAPIVDQYDRMAQTGADHHTARPYQWLV